MSSVAGKRLARGDRKREGARFKSERSRRRRRRGEKLSHTLVQLLEAFKLRGEATLAGSVDDKDDLALQLGQIIDIALLCALLSVLLSRRQHSRSLTI